MSDTLRAQMEAMTGTGDFADLGPLVDIEAQQRPQWSALDLQSMSDMLRGVGGQQGLLGLYREHVMPSLSESEAGANRYRRLSDIADVTSMGEAATQASLGADPLKKRASDMLLGGAIDDFKLGAKLDPSLARQVQQSYRNAVGSRGLAYSPYSASEESYWQGLQANQLKQQRQAALSSLLGQRQQMVGDPFMQILGRQGQAFSTAGGYGSQGQGMASGIGPKIFQPESQYAGDIAASNYQGQLAARTASGQNRSGMMSGLFQGLGSAICHVAREVYGEENPKWVEFYVWKETKGPRWFKALYNEYSEQWAGFVKDKPRLKSCIKKWMDTKLGDK